MNIVVINDYASVQGGSAQVAVLSVLGLAKLGYKVTFVFGGGYVDQRLIHKNIELIDLNQSDLVSNSNFFSSIINGLWNLDVEEAVTKVLNRFEKNNTIVHVHSWVKSLSISSISSVIKLKFPFVITLHDYFAVCPNGGFYNFPKQEICEYKPLSLSCMLSNCDSRSYIHKIWRVVRQELYRIANFPTEEINFIFVTDFSKNIIKDFLPNKAVYWKVTNPIDIEIANQAVPSRSNKLTYVGRLTAEKGVLLFTKLKNIGHECLQFLGTGDLEPVLKKSLPKASFLGWCDREQLSAVLNDTRALVFTSQLYETQGLVVAEAAAKGIPAVVSDATAAKEYVVDNNSGVLFQSGSVASLEDALNRLNDDFLVDQLGNNAYVNYWANPPTLERHVRELTNCYQEILIRASNER